MPAPPNYVFTIFAFVSFFLCLIRFPMQWHAWNVGVRIFLVWVGLSSLVLGINSIIWRNNTVNWAPVWCDISSRLTDIGSGVGLPATILSINRRLYFLASPTSLLPSEADKHREIMIDFAIGIGLPIIAMILWFFIQNGRYEIYEGYGCRISILNSWVSVVIVNVPTILLELIAGVYDCLVIHTLYKRRSQLNELLPSHKNLNSNRFIRLMCFSVCDLLFGIPVTITFLCFNVVSGLNRFPGLKQEHHFISHIFQVPTVVWRANTIHELILELNRWIIIFSAFVFFAAFSFIQESCNDYRTTLLAIPQFFRMMTGVKSRPTSSTSQAEGITFKVTTRELSMLVDTVNSDVGPSAV